RDGGAAVHALPADGTVGLDSIYVRDASIACDRGVILCSMGKPQRAAEPAAQRTALRALGIPIHGAITPPGRVEGGDVVWIDERTLAVGQGYRTNAEGIRQLQALLAGCIAELLVVPLPHWRGPNDAFHLMSILSPIDDDLFLAYSPLLPVPFRERLLERFVKQLAQLKQEMDEGKLQSSEYDQRLARAIRELREQKLDADRAAVSQALADALRSGLITPAVKAHIEKRLGLS